MTGLKMLCPDHLSYTGKRRPRRSCPSCWRVYFFTSGKILEEYAEAASKDIQSYLWRHLSRIKSAPVIMETSFESKVEMATKDDLDDFEDKSENPQKEKRGIPGKLV